jgi:sugar lactone lactonase YvrE
MSILLLGLFPGVESGAQNVRFQPQAAVYVDKEDGSLSHPEGVAAEGTGAIMVADSGNGRLLRYRFEPDLGLTNTSVIKIPQLNYPTKIQLDRSGDLFVLDRKPPRIVRLSADGRFRGYVTPTGAAPPVPKSFALHDSGTLYILDAVEPRVLIVGTDGTVRSQIDITGPTEFLTDVAVDDMGRVLILDGVAGTIYAVDRGSQALAPLARSLKQFTRFPTALTTDDRRRIYLSDRNGGRIIVLGQDGSFLGRLSERGWKAGLLNYPSQIFIDRDNLLYVADTLNSRIQVFQLPD